MLAYLWEVSKARPEWFCPQKYQVPERAYAKICFAPTVTASMGSFSSPLTF